MQMETCFGLLAYAVWDGPWPKRGTAFPSAQPVLCSIGQEVGSGVPGPQRAVELCHCDNPKPQ